MQIRTEIFILSLCILFYLIFAVTFRTSDDVSFQYQSFLKNLTTASMSLRIGQKSPDSLNPSSPKSSSINTGKYPRIRPILLENTEISTEKTTEAAEKLNTPSEILGELKTTVSTSPHILSNLNYPKTVSTLPINPITKPPIITLQETEKKITTSFDKIYNQTKTYPLNPAQLKVLIIAQYRGGSTLSSEIFNINPNSMYVFEPLVLRFRNILTKLEGARNTLSDEENYQLDQKYAKEQNAILHDFFYCNLPDLTKYLTRDYLLKVHRSNTVYDNLYSKCKQTGLCFAHYSRELFQPPFCQTSKFDINAGGTLTGSCLKTLKQTLPVHWPNVCRSKMMIAAKVIRLDDPNILVGTELYKDPNFKIILVIRDPRGIINSRIILHSKRKQNNFAKDTLDAVKWNALNLKERYQSYIKLVEQTDKIDNHPEKVLIFRYEDFALDSNKYTEKIYNFLQLDIKNNPEHLKNFNYVKDKLFKETHGQAKKSPTSSFGTADRDATKIISKWKNTMDWQIVDHIQKHFGGKDIWERVGYRFYENKEDYERADEGSVVEKQWFGAR